MCGIAGSVDFNNPPDRMALWAMARTLKRRGPDSSGVWADGPCGLAHTRLSVIDVAGSPQPMVLSEPGFAIVYNGETYNFKQLRQMLANDGERCRTNGDTEVVLRWLAKRWCGALPHFDAMFALACWNQREQKLLLARDAIGEKPLFYACPTPGVLVFASEIKALLVDPRIDAALDEDGLRQILRFRAVYRREGLLKGVKQLDPGSYLEFSRDGIKAGRYIDPLEKVRQAQKQSRSMSDEELIHHGNALFLESVSERLIADAPVGAFLSGGLDSSLIVAATQKVCSDQQPIQTFSVGFRGDPNSELGHAETVARAFGTIHREISVGPEAYVQRLAELSYCRDGPVSQPADVAIAEMSRLARQFVKVVLSGEGADEVFAGYPKHLYSNPSRLMRSLLTVIGPEAAARLVGFVGVDRTRALVAFRAMTGATEVDRLVQWFSYLDRNALFELFPGLRWSAADIKRTVANQAAMLSELHSETPLLRMQMLDFATWLPGNMLERGDRMTMAEGLELRLPFLDVEFAFFGLALPNHLKVQQGVGKWIVRQWAKNVLPPSIISRAKWGFRVPLTEWFRGPLRDMLYSYLTRADGLIARYGDRAAVSRLLLSHDTGQTDAAQTLWTLLTSEIWYADVYLARRRVNGPPSITEPPISSV